MNLKNVFISALTLLFVSVLFVACNDESGGQNNAAETTTNTPATTTPAPPQAPVNMNAQTTPQPTETGAVKHYICPNNCEGSGGAAQGTCPVCGTQYAHNAAFHSQQPAQQNTSPMQTTPTNTQTANPGQNAAGQWHYVCSAGCPGGSGTAGTCGTCGGSLAHNQAYHN